MPGSPVPDPIVEAFGTSAGASYITYPIPVPSQIPANPGYASFTDGFPPATMTPEGSGGVPPRGQDMNGILYMLSAYCALQTGGQFWQYNATYEAAVGGYATGAVLAMAAGNGFWLNTVSGNTNNPDTTAAATSGWVPLACYGSTALTGLTGGSVTLTAPQAATPILTLAGTLTSNLSLIFPTWLKHWRVVNNTTGSFTITCKTASGTGVNVPQFGSAGYTDVYGDGTNIDLYSQFAQGSFNVTWTGFSSNPSSSTLQYVVVGKTVTIYFPNGLLGTSNSSAFSFSGIPTFLLPASQTVVPIGGMEDNSAAISTCLFSVNTFGNGAFWNGPVASTNWTPSGTKGIEYAATVTYVIP